MSDREGERESRGGDRDGADRARSRSRDGGGGGGGGAGGEESKLFVGNLSFDVSEIF
jgi:hypothetical protein